MNQKKGVSAWNLAIALIIIYMIMPIVSRFISTYLTTYFYMLIVVFAFLRIVFGRRARSFNEYMGGILLPFALYQALTFFIRTESIVFWGYSVLLELLPVMMGYYIMRYHQEDINFYAKIIVVAIIFTGITTIVGLIQFPRASRILATIASSKDALAVMYDWHNIGGYYFIYLLVLLYPIFILAYKRKKINRTITIIGSIMLYAMVILSEYATALLLLLITTVLFFMKKDMSKQKIILLMIIGVVVILIFNDYVSDFLKSVGSWTGSDAIEERFTALAGGQETLEEFNDNRLELYRHSMQEFLAHPVFGTFLSGSISGGGHSFILDTFANYGMLGAGLLFYMYRRIYHFFIEPFKNEQGYGFVFWAFLQTIILSTVNTGMWLEVIALMLPILVSSIYGYGDRKYEGTLDCQ